ncbi:MULTISPECIES: hypothetical protein [Pantoea]|uniref:hypothetical protein n=1 Tax=Pantoea TaxID=53335 RepID=UPI001CC1D22F|nr:MULTISPECIES: hypothetical protein [Pantoea]
MNYKISGLDAGPFIHLFGQSESYLKKHNAIRQKVECYPVYPAESHCVISPRGKTALLINTNPDTDRNTNQPLTSHL